MRVFTAMRILGGGSGTFILLAGQTILSDIFEPVSFMISLVSTLVVSIKWEVTDCSGHGNWLLHDWDRYCASDRYDNKPLSTPSSY